MTVRIMFKYVAFSGPHFPVFLFSPYSLQMWENTDQKKLPNGHFLHSEDVSNSIRGKCRLEKILNFNIIDAVYVSCHYYIPALCKIP